MSVADLILILAFAAVVLIAAFVAGRSEGRGAMVHHLLGMKRVNNRWEVPQDTTLIGMKWVSPHYVFNDGKELRRVNWTTDHWEFDDGSVPSQVASGLTEIPGHWELPDGQKIDPLQMDPLKLADAFHEWVKNASKIVDFGLATLQLLPKQGKVEDQRKIIKEYGEILEKGGPIFRRDSSFRSQRRKSDEVLQRLR
jgi:hypothetical protein